MRIQLLNTLAARYNQLVDLASFRSLLTPSGQQALEAALALAPGETDFLRAFTRLSRSYPADLARAALETAILRRQAAAKFPQASLMVFTREALEQATAFEVSAYRCARFSGCNRLLDLGCSIGGDTLALAALAPTTGLDLDPLRLAIAQANLRSVLPEQPVDFIQADLRRALPVRLSPGMGLFFDPARRDRGRRIHSPGNYQPPLDVIRGWLAHTPALGVKLSPGIDPNELAGYDAELEFISLNGELKEAVLWFGPLKSARRRATLLPGAHTLAASLDERGKPGKPGAPDGWSDSGPGLAAQRAARFDLRAGPGHPAGRIGAGARRSTGGCPTRSRHRLPDRRPPGGDAFRSRLRG